MIDNLTSLSFQQKCVLVIMILGEIFMGEYFIFHFIPMMFSLNWGRRHIKYLIDKDLMPNVSRLKYRRVKHELVGNSLDYSIKQNCIDLHENLDSERYLDMTECFCYFENFTIRTLYYIRGIIEIKFANLISARNSCNLEDLGVPKVISGEDWLLPLHDKCRLHDSTTDPHYPELEVKSIWF